MRLCRVHRTMAVSCESLSIEGFSLCFCRLTPYQAVKPPKPTPFTVYRTTLMPGSVFFLRACAGFLQLCCVFGASGQVQQILLGTNTGFAENVFRYRVRRGWVLWSPWLWTGWLAYWSAFRNRLQTYGKRGRPVLSLEFIRSRSRDGWIPRPQ